MAHLLRGTLNNKQSFINVKWKINVHSVTLAAGICHSRAAPAATPGRQCRPVLAKHRMKNFWLRRRAPCKATALRSLRSLISRGGGGCAPPPATLIQLFGTKRGLLLRVASTAPAAVPQQFAAARGNYQSPLKTLVELYAGC